MYSLTQTSLLASFLLSGALAAPQLVKKQSATPAINANFPDPAVFQDADGTWYAFATASGDINIQVAKSSDFATWELQDGVDALSGAPAWSPSTPNTWAPDVIMNDDGTYVMFFAATSNEDTTKHCVGSATASAAAGPYTPASTPFACPLDQGGAIDPAAFHDDDGSRYVVYKVDGNSLGGGGSCGNADGEYATPIMLQPVEGDGVTPSGDATQILDRDDNDGPLIEAPSLVKSDDGTYFLYFSSNCYNTPLYDVSYATASSVSGPYTKAAKPLFETGYEGLTAPGGADAPNAAGNLAFHANLAGGGRGMFTATVSYGDDGVITPS